MAVPVVAMLAIEGLKVELVDDVEDEPGEVALREPVALVWWEQEGLVSAAVPDSRCWGVKVKPAAGAAPRAWRRSSRVRKDTARWAWSSSAADAPSSASGR